jgi:hypothetical protein
MRQIVSLSVLAALLGLVGGCGRVEDIDESSSAQKREAALAACHLNDGTVGRDDELRACDPQNKKKTTICHIPPGNPANAHTLCIGNAGVPAHLKNHGDSLGPCKRETSCPMPDAGAPGAGGQTGGIDSGGAGGAGGTGAGGTGGVIE